MVAFKTLRPKVRTVSDKAVRENVRSADDYLQKVVKYIPAEVIAIYAAGMGAIEASFESSCLMLKWYGSVWFLLLLVLTPLWMMFALRETDSAGLVIRPPAFQIATACFAYAVWAYAQGTGVVIWLGDDCSTPGVENLIYKPAIGSLMLMLTTFLIPILEGIFNPEKP
jgi:hypothetical protein